MSVGLTIAGAALKLGGTLISSKLASDARAAALAQNEAEYYMNPLETVAGKALLKKRAQDREEAIAAQNNRAIAGGATFENQLAMRKALNRADSDFENNILMNSEARRRQLSDQRAQIIQGGYMQDAQNWQAWGNAASDALMAFGSTYLLNDNNTGSSDFALMKAGKKNYRYAPLAPPRQQKKNDGLISV